PDGRHREHRGQLAGELALEPPARPEPLRAREVDGQHHRELTLLDVSLYEGTAHARRDVPVDGAHFVSRLVLAHLGELHPLPLEHGAVLAREERVHEPARLELQQLHLPEYLGGDGGRLVHGLSTVARTRRTISSLETSSASASYVVSTR